MRDPLQQKNEPWRQKLYFGERLAWERERRGWTLREMGALVHVKHTTISRYEQGLLYPSGEIVGKLALALDMEASALFQRPGETYVAVPSSCARLYTDLLHELATLPEVLAPPVLQYIRTLNPTTRPQDGARRGND